MIGKLDGFNAVCGSKDFDDELDRRALCQLFCCCLNAGKQRCVADVLKQADASNGYKGYYKQEVPYLNREPVMSRTQPVRATRGRPAGSRIPDVVVVKDPNLPPALDNVQKAYEMKFPGDSYSSDIGSDGKTQWEAYQALFGDDIDKKPMTEESCNCKDSDNEELEKDSILQKALSWDLNREKAISLVDRVNSDAAAAAGAAAGATALGRLGELAAGAIRLLGLAF